MNIPLQTSVPLIDLGTMKSEWAGILSPGYQDKFIQTFIQKQFLEDAAIYAERYDSEGAWRGLIQGACRNITVDACKPRILDIGSGAGSSVFPLLDLYPDATVVASDLSAPLLKILKDRLAERCPGRTCALVQLNAEELVFANEQFDLVCGGSVLHHLFKPEKTIAECYRVLRPGGCAFFFEPFELGNLVLSMVLKHLIAMNAEVAGRHALSGFGLGWLRSLWRGTEQIPPEVLRFFNAICVDYEARKGDPRSEQHLSRLDDKQLFTRSQFQHMAQVAGFAQVNFEPIGPTENMFTTQTSILLNCGGLNRDVSALPFWARAYLQEMDRHFSRNTRPELMFEGCVVFRKAGRVTQAAA
jgi:ubiquinone/menaquinone biosynthesis C-methylase UbiE